MRRTAATTTSGAYYEAKGEAPGVWMGSGVTTVPNFHPQHGVTEAQMGRPVR